MGIRHPQIGVFSKRLLGVLLLAALGCSLFKKKDDDQALPAPLTSVTTPQPPVFNVNAAEAVAATGGSAATVEPAQRRATGHAGAAAKGAGGAPTKPGSASPSATPSVAVPAAAPTVAVTPLALPAVSPACVGACTTTFSSCTASSTPQQMQSCQQALKVCMDTCTKQ